MLLWVSHWPMVNAEESLRDEKTLPRVASVQYPNVHIIPPPFHFRVKVIRDKSGEGFMGINKILSHSQSNIQILSWQRNS